MFTKEGGLFEEPGTSSELSSESVSELGWDLSVSRLFLGSVNLGLRAGLADSELSAMSASIQRFWSQVWLSEITVFRALLSESDFSAEASRVGSLLRLRSETFLPKWLMVIDSHARIWTAGKVVIKRGLSGLIRLPRTLPPAALRVGPLWLADDVGVLGRLLHTTSCARPLEPTALFYL